MYYRSTKVKPKAQERFAESIKTMIEKNPSFGYRTVTAGMKHVNFHDFRHPCASLLVQPGLTHTR